MDGWVDGWMDRWVDGWMDGWVGVWMDGWIDGWVDGWMNGWMDEWMGGYVRPVQVHSNCFLNMAISKQWDYSIGIQCYSAWCVCLCIPNLLSVLRQIVLAT